MSDAQDWTEGVPLEAADEALIEELGVHPDRDSGEVPGSLRWWDAGFRGLYYWRDEGHLVCSQFLVTQADNSKFGGLGVWEGMYLPLTERVGLVEHLHAYSGHRGRGAASRFGREMARLAQSRGLRKLVTHIGETNVPALGWARKLGWSETGRVEKWNVDLRGIRQYWFFVHRGR